jgi:WD40-like Beta Propeller Repeat/SPOR domain
MQMRRIILTFTLLLFYSWGFAQTKKDETKLAKEALGYFSAAQFLDAFPLYSQLVSLSPTNTDYVYHFGVCALFCDQDKANAIKYLRQAEKSGYSNVELFYYLGRAYHFSYQFSEASRYYELYLDNANQKELEKHNALRAIQMCIYGTKLLKNPKELTVKKKVDADKQGFYRLMNLEAVGGKIIVTPTPLLNSKDKKSTQPHLVHINGTPKVIYYSSYSDSSALDIWQAEIQPDGNYGTPKKVPGLVNSMEDEDYPFLHPNGKTLYFSSTGHNSMGGFDIYRSELDTITKRWKKPVNLGFAFNSPGDDVFFICDAANQTAIFASDRTSDHNHYSLYQTTFEGKPIDVIYAKANFFSDLNPNNGAAQIVVKDLETGEVISDLTSDSKTGKFDVYFPKAGRYSYTITIPDQEQKFTQEFDVQPDKSGSVYFPQQVHLVKDDKGKTAVVVKNGADAKMDNTMEDAFAGLLRTKAKMEVSKVDTDPSSLELSMTNAPAIAGFAKGKTPQDVLSDMQNELNEASTKSAQFDEQKKKAYQFAKQNLVGSQVAYATADSLVAIVNKKMEKDKQNGKPFMISEEDKVLLEKSIAFRNLGDQKRIQAEASLQIAKQIETYQATLPELTKTLKEESTKLQAYIKENNVQETIEILKKERSRLLQEQSRPKKPSNALPANAKSTALEHEANAKQYDELLNSLYALEAKSIEDQNNQSPSLAQTREAAKRKKTEVLTFDKKVKGTYDDAAAAKEANLTFNKIKANEDLGILPEFQKDISATDITDLKDKIESLSVKSSDPNPYLAVYEQAKISPYRNYDLEQKIEVDLAVENKQLTADKKEVAEKKVDNSEAQDKNNKTVDNTTNKNQTVKQDAYSAKKDDNNDVALALKSAKVMKQIIDSASFKEYDPYYAYEERDFYNLLKKYPIYSGSFKDRARYDSIQNALSDLETKMKSEQDPAKKATLQKQFTTLQKQRSIIEIKNKDAYRDVAYSELNIEKDKAIKNLTINKAKLDKEKLLNKLIKNLQNDADSLIKVAKIDREKAEKTSDENERARLLRSAFSKEMTATDMYQHINKAVDALPIFELYMAKDEAFLINATPDEIRSKYTLLNVTVDKTVDNDSVDKKEDATVKKDDDIVKKDDAKNNDNVDVSQDLKDQLQSLNTNDKTAKKDNQSTPKIKRNDNNVGPYKDLPKRVDKTYFVKLNTNAYDDSNPIPVDRPMPDGIVYTVQVGAFRNPIPNNTFRQFSPVRGEHLNNGLTRYTVGLFNEKAEATKARDVIRSSGFPDAFVVVYKDGKKVADPFYLKTIEKENLPDNENNLPVSDPKSKDNNAVVISSQDEGFYTIQIGVFGRPANADELKLDNVLLHYSATTNLYRYSYGKYNKKSQAISDLSKVREKGFTDAFVTAYYKGQKISLSKADQLTFKNRPELKEKDNLDHPIVEDSVKTDIDTTFDQDTSDLSVSENEKDNSNEVIKDTIQQQKKDTVEVEQEIYEFKLSEIYGIYKCCEEDQGICNNPDNKEVVKSLTLISNGSGVAITGKNETINFQWKFVKDSDTPIQGMEKILGDNYSFYYKNGIIHLGNYCKPKDK